MDIRLGMRFALVVVVLSVAAGCSANAASTRLVYRPGPPEAGGEKLPVNVAVVPFKDATENFSRRGTIYRTETLTFNAVKSASFNTMDPLPPEFWAEALAEDLEASGMFRSVRFAAGEAEAELMGDRFVVCGAVERAYIAGHRDNLNDFAVRLRLSARPGGQVVGEQVLAKTWRRGDALKECGTSQSCRVERFHADVNKALQDIFGQARRWLVKSLSSASAQGSPAVPAGAGPGSVEETIERILRDK